MLIIFSRKSGAGKTTLAQALARKLDAFHVRVDTIAGTLLAAGCVSAVDGVVGYVIGRAIAEDNLRLGRTVIADSVNPIKLTRDAWREVAERAASTSVDVAIVCSSDVEHKRRIEARPAIGRRQTWQQVLAREFEPVERSTIVIDTAGEDVEQSLAKLHKRLTGDGPS